MNETITLVEYVAQQLMKDSGYDREDRSSIEWDKEHPESQYSINLDIAKVCVEATVDALRTLGLLSDEKKEDPIERNPQYDVDQDYPIHKQATIYMILKAKDFDPLTLGDVRRWVKEVDEIRLPDSTHVEGDLSLMYDIGLSAVEYTTYSNEDGETEALLLHGRSDDLSPYNPAHPSIINKDPKLLLEKTYQALLKKYDYLVEQGQADEAAKILGEIQRIKDAARR